MFAGAVVWQLVWCRIEISHEDRSVWQAGRWRGSLPSPLAHLVMGVLVPGFPAALLLKSLGAGAPLRLFILERRDVIVCKQPLAILEDEVHDGLAPVETLGVALPVMPWHMTDGDEVRPSFCVDEWLWERMAP